MTNWSGACKSARSELSATNLELNREIKERKRAEADLRSLAAKVLKIQDEERRRIARDLHDGVGQTLAGALMAVAQARSFEAQLPAACGSALRQVEDLLQQGTREVRTVSHLLHPPLLDESGLMSAIRWYVEEFSKRSRIAVTLELEDEAESPDPRDRDRSIQNRPRSFDQRVPSLEGRSSTDRDEV